MLFVRILKKINLTTYISILRGINVSGQKKIQMKDLKKMYEALNFKEVTTYIQSGNVIFKTDEKASIHELSLKISNRISDQYNFSVPVIIRNAKDMENTLKNNPFISEPGIDIARLHVTFLAEIPKLTLIENLKNTDQTTDRFRIIDREIYLYCPNGYGITKLSNTYFEKKLQVTATTRNWKTIQKLVEIAESISIP